MPFPEFDEVHVVSDLHMGGEKDFQIFRETEKLAGFINWVEGRCPEGRVALVLNGDVIDTLAEKGVGYIAVDNAVTVVERIMADDEFEKVWDALSDYVKSESRTLVMVLGNHDLELSFPVVQLAIIERLAGDDPAARGRIRFSTMGAGYNCLVGGARVFCTHGNEVDPWNYIRYEDLAKAGRRLNSGRTLKTGEWEPNAGTKMVKDVMNEVKLQYPWIDLLKPEIKVAVGVLLALDPGQSKKILSLIPVIGERVEGGMEVDQRLSAEGFTVPVHKCSQPTSVYNLLGPSLKAGLQKDAGGNLSTADDLLLAAEKEYKTGSADTDPEDETLGLGGYIWDRLTGWITGIGKEEALRLALKDWFEEDNTFKIWDRDDTCKDVVASVGRDIHFLITGHTHLERAIDLKDGRFYFNCGTWIRLLRLTEEMLENPETFKPVYDLLKNCRMADLDKAVFDGNPFVLPKQSAVCIRKEAGKVISELAHIQGTDQITRKIEKQFSR